ncbi:MAG: Rieske 2Fe-2S domain-containing protein [Pseudomonadota bacterium]
MNLAQHSARWYNPDTGTLDRRIFTDADIYRQELSHIFGRAWNFVCHESQIPARGDFFMSYIGAEEVIVVRHRDGSIHVLLNSCPHRGNTVCRAELGSTRSFFCSYHGWNFDLDGTLIGMPNEVDFYRGEFDKSAWGLGSAAQVASYRGFVFATMDSAAPPLDEYLGWVGRLGIDMLAGKGDLEVVDGIHKNRLQCNWKLAVDNLFDWYHVKVSHGTSMRLGLLPEETISADAQMVILGAYGHGIGGPGLKPGQLEALGRRKDGDTSTDAEWFDMQAAWRTQPGVREQLGETGVRSLGHPSIFPNLWVALTNQVCLRIPRGPLETELWWFTFMPTHLTPEQRRTAIWSANHYFGPAGFLEQDDGENWSHSTRGAGGQFTGARPLNFAMGLGQDYVGEDGGQHSIETVVNEHGQRWTYQNWQEWMLAANWPELMATGSPPPDGLV